jgi:hypothetical protein
MRKPKRVELINTKGVRKSFGSAHAVSVLTYSNLWSLPEDSKLELTEDGIRVKPNKGTDKESEE